MSEVTYTQFLRLKTALGLRWAGAIMLAALLEAPDGRVDRADLLKLLRSSGYAMRDDGKQFDVTLSQLNAKLPATVSVGPTWTDNIRYERRRGGSLPASFYEISSEWAREHLWRIARGEAIEPKGRAAA